MIVTVSNVITIDNFTPDILKWCEKTLTFKNPEYTKKLKMGLWLGKTPETIRLYEIHGNQLVIPFGMLRKLLLILPSDTTLLKGFKTPANVPFGGVDIPLYDYQKTAVERMYRNKYGMLIAPCGSGKGLPLYAKVYTPDGYTRNGDLKVGDEVLNPDGGISKVTGVYDRGIQPCYKITFTDDTAITCDKDHLWQVQDCYDERKQWKVMSTYELFHQGYLNKYGRRKWRIPITTPVLFKPQKVTIDPWLMGILLGDGSFCDGSISVSNSECDILSRIEKIIGSKLRHSKTRVNAIIVDKGKIKYRLEDYSLYGLHSWEKFIPKEYKYNSIDVRLNVLRGLIDSDGSVDGTSVTITSTSRRLIEDCLEIVQSLGGTGRISTRNTKYTYDGIKKEGRTSYRLTLKLYDYQPFSSEKHTRNATPRTKYTTAYRIIKSIEITAPRQTRCISVDSESALYLIDGFVVTHNTQSGLAIVKKWQHPALWLTHTTDLLNQAMTRAKQYIDPELIGTITEGKVNIGKGITFATVQTMSKIDLPRYKDEWDSVIVDECHRVAASPTGVAMFQKVLNNLSARHKYGLTATPHRADGMMNAAYAILGDIVHEVPPEAVGDKIVKVGIKAISTGTQLTPECLNEDGTKNFTRTMNYLAGNADRNRLIVEQIISEREHSCLILSHRLSQLVNLRCMIPEKMRDKAAIIDGKSPKLKREQALEDMRNGTKQYLFATFSLAREGLDIPRLDRLFMALPVSDSAVTEQSIGRIARAFDGKDPPIAYDFVDDFRSAEYWYKSRLKVYRKIGAEFV